MSKQLYKHIIDSLPHALLVLDEELRVVQCNRRCEILFSKTKNAILSSNLSELIPHKELRGQAKAAMETNETKLVELHLEADNPKILRATVTSIDSTTQNENAFCLLTLEDVSERTRFEEQLVLSEKLAGMGMLASTIAHELGNPLSIMTSTLQYTRDTLLDTKNLQLEAAVRKAGIIEAVDTIMDSIGRMHELLQVLSGFTGFQLPRFEPTDLDQVLSQMLTFIHNEAEAHKIKVYRHFDDNLPNCEVDRREVKQLFLNLLKNAIEAMPNGGELHARMYLGESKDAICIDIRDTGHGISETEMRTIFRPFYSTKPNGTGLGLAFCRRVVEEHGGEISVKSKLSEGSTFSVVLPVRQGGDV